ncbi:MAG: hypothetical protein R6U19_09970 [Bacteroidales bacterium]
MKPFKNLFPLVLWLLRLALVLVVYVRFFENLKAFNYNSLSFFISAAFTLFALLLLVGGFGRKHGLTMLSGMVIAVLSVYQMIQLNFVTGHSLALYSLMTVAGLVFVSNGNRK